MPAQIEADWAFRLTAPRLELEDKPAVFSWWSNLWERRNTGTSNLLSISLSWAFCWRNFSAGRVLKRRISPSSSITGSMGVSEVAI